MNILKLNEISDVVHSILPSGRYTFGDVAPDAVLVRSANMHDRPVADSLLAVARAGAGVNNIPVEAYAEKGIVVFNTPGANANAVKELALATLFVLSRNILSAADWVKTLKGKGDAVPALVEKGKGQFVGPELLGKTLGVVGLGAIGAKVAEGALALGMRVCGVDPFLSVEQAWGLARGIEHAPSEDALLAASDYVTLHVPLLPSTKGKVNREYLSKMKKGAFLLNLARGELVDEGAIIEALESGHLAGYAVDFPTDALIGVPGVVCIPHLGASTPESEENCAEMAARQLRDYLETGSIQNAVQFPDCRMPTSGNCHVVVLHKNIPNVVAQIASVMGKLAINIEESVNKSKGAWACTMLALDKAVPEDALRQLEAIEGTVRVRAL